MTISPPILLDLLNLSRRRATLSNNALFLGFRAAATARGLVQTVLPGPLNLVSQKGFSQFKLALEVVSITSVP